MMSKRVYSLLVLLAALLFILLNSYLVYSEKSILLIAPFTLIVLMLVLFAPDFVFYSLFFLAPLSIPLKKIVPGLDFDFWVPTEPLILMLLLVLILKSLYSRYFDQKITSYPVFWAIAFYLGWLLIASIGSEMPIVSIKYTLVRVWFISIFFYLAYLMLLKNPRSIYKMMGLYMSGLSIVILISLARQVQRGLLDRSVAHGTCVPFFPDHTSYGAVLSFIIPIAIAIAVVAKNKWLKFFMYGVSAFFTLALFLSFTRAAWLSSAIGLGVWVLWRFRIKFRTVFITSVVVIFLGFTFWGDIIRWLNSNQEASSGGLRQQVTSIVNVTTDDSNVERLNRWTSALRMYKEKPFLGFGPGTYQFEYAPYQSANLRTLESSNLGKKGNAHSEYLGLMSESGTIAIIAFVLIIALTIAGAFRVMNKLGKCPDRTMVLGMLIGFITYVTHAFMNNFLDMDKVAALFWVTVALVLASDVRSGKIEAKN